MLCLDSKATPNAHQQAAVVCEHYVSDFVMEKSKRRALSESWHFYRSKQVVTHRLRVDIVDLLLCLIRPLVSLLFYANAALGTTPLCASKTF